MNSTFGKAVGGAAGLEDVLTVRSEHVLFSYGNDSGLRVHCLSVANYVCEGSIEGPPRATTKTSRVHGDAEPTMQMNVDGTNA